MPLFLAGVFEGDGGSNFNCKASNFLVSLISERLAAEGAGVGCGGVGTRTTDIRAIRAQSCITTVPERSYVTVL